MSFISWIFQQMIVSYSNNDNRQDANIAGQATGAMSWAFITALKKNPQQSYVQLLNSIRDELESKYTQKPQLSCSHPLSKVLSSLLLGHWLTMGRYEFIVRYVRLWSRSTYLSAFCWETRVTVSGKNRASS